MSGLTRRSSGRAFGAPGTLCVRPQRHLTVQISPRAALNSALPIATRLSSIPLMVVLTVILVPTGHLLLFCLLLLPGELIHLRRLRLLRLRIHVLVLLRHSILLRKVVCECAIAPINA